jgi:hypothetical protein
MSSIPCVLDCLDKIQWVLRLCFQIKTRDPHFLLDPIRLQVGFPRYNLCQHTAAVRVISPVKLV